MGKTGRIHSLFQTQFSPEGLPWGVAIQKDSASFLYHWHDAVEILLGVTGKTEVGIVGQSYTLREGDIVIIGPQESHCVFPESGSTHLALDFEPSVIFTNPNLASYANSFSMVESHSVLWSPESRECIKSLLEAMYQINQDREPGWELLIFSKLMEITAYVVRDLPSRDLQKQGPNENMIRRALEYLSRHYLEEITAKDCAQSLGFNASYFSHSFHKQVGVSFHQYLVDLRLNQAEWLLRNTNSPIPYISEKSGFSSVKTFYRVFQKRNGKSPGAFRAKKEHE